MDRNTLSHYGWIVIVVIILAILMGLAYPFGNFIANGATGVLESFSNDANIVVGSSKLDEIAGGSKNVTTPTNSNVEEYYYRNVFNVNGPVEEGGSDVFGLELIFVEEGDENGLSFYSTESFRDYLEGNQTGDREFTNYLGEKVVPETKIPNDPKLGDVYVCGDYMYVYGLSGMVSWGTIYYAYDETGYYGDSEIFDGWSVKAITTNKESYDPFLTSVAGKPVVSMAYCFYGYQGWEDMYPWTSGSIKSVPVIPSTITDISNAFKNCNNLTEITFETDPVISNLKYEDCISYTGIKNNEQLLVYSEGNQQYVNAEAAYYILRTQPR